VFLRFKRLSCKINAVKLQEFCKEGRVNLVSKLGTDSTVLDALFG
jgi:hypothetical protein